MGVFNHLAAVGTTHLLLLCVKNVLHFLLDYCLTLGLVLSRHHRCGHGFGKSRGGRRTSRHLVFYVVLIGLGLRQEFRFCVSSLAYLGFNFVLLLRPGSLGGPLLGHLLFRGSPALFKFKLLLRLVPLGITVCLILLLDEGGPAL